MEIINYYIPFKKIPKNFKKENKKFNSFTNLLNTLLIILILLKIAKEKTLSIRKFNLESEITMTIIGIGEQPILSESFSGIKPDKIFVNGDYYGEKSIKVAGLTQNRNTIKMSWNSPLTNCFNMFNGLSNIINIDFSKFETSEITNMGSMFNSCISLTSLDLSNFNTSSVEIMYSMFSNCISLAYLNISNFNTSLISNMNAMFFRCARLTSLDLGSFNTSSVTFMGSTFHDCSSLKYLNINSFNTSLVQNMYCAFYNCSSLTSLDVRHFNTSSVINFQGMFGQMHSLISLNLSTFDTSKANNMEGLFGGSYSLLSLDISNFNISLVNDILGMFFDLKSLIFLNLNSLIEIKDQTILKNNFFGGINEKLILCLDLEKNPNIVSVIPENIISNNDCNNECFSKLIKIDIKEKKCINNCEMSSLRYEYNNICYITCPENTHISPINNFLCIDDCEKINKYYNYEQTSCIYKIPEGYFVNNTSLKTIDKCHPDCKECEKKYDENNSYCKSCLNDKFLYLGNCVTHCNNSYYKDLYGNKICNCFNNKCKECSIESNKLDLCISCNQGYYTKIDDISNNNYFIDCYKDPDGYYLDNDIYKPCYPSCQKCNELGDLSNNNCLSCKPGYFSLDNGTNCYEICQYYYYFNSSNIYQCTEGNECPKEQHKLIKEKNKCIKNCTDDDIYKCEFKNICYEICPEEEFISEVISNILYIKECPEKIPYLFKNNTCTQECDALDFFNEICKINNNNPVIREEMIKKIKRQLTNKELNLLLLNVTDGEKKDLLIKEFNVTYQITTTDNQKNNNYENLSRILLNECEDILRSHYHIDSNKSLIIFKVDYYMEGISIPLIGYEVYHPDTKEKLELKYCQEVLIDYIIPVSIDENNLFKYDPNDEYYNDECLPFTTDNGTDILLNDRKEEFIINNLSLCENNCKYNGYNEITKKVSCKCEIKDKDFVITEIFYEKDILSNNFTFENYKSNLKTMKCANTLFTKNGLISNIASYILIFNLIIYLVLFILYFKIGVFMIDKDIEGIIKEKENQMNSCTVVPREKKKKRGRNKAIGVFKNNPSKKKKKKSKTMIIKKKLKKEVKSYSKIEFNNTNVLGCVQNEQKNYLQIYTKKKSNLTNSNNLEDHHFYDSELNALDYKMALLFDKRDYILYYISLIKTKHPLIFTFLSNSDYNLIILKISIIILSYAVYFGVNTLFFNDSSIHQVYENNGNYNMNQQMLKIIGSFIISHIICIMLKYFFLPEKYLLKIKYETPFENIRNKTNEMKRLFFIKYICFYIFGLVFLIFLWYYLSSFGAVYTNSQIYPFINTLLSIIISLLYPFFINLIPGFLRIPSLNKNKSSERLYNISKILQIL